MEATYFRTFLSNFVQKICTKICCENKLDVSTTVNQLGKISMDDKLLMEIDSFFKNHPELSIDFITAQSMPEPAKKKVIVRKKKTSSNVAVSLEEPQPTVDPQPIVEVQPTVDPQPIVEVQQPEPEKPMESNVTETNKKKVTIRKKKSTADPIPIPTSSTSMDETNKDTMTTKKKLLVKKKKSEVAPEVPVASAAPNNQLQITIPEQNMEVESPLKAPKNSSNKIKTIDLVEDEPLPDLPKQNKVIKHEYNKDKDNEYGSLEVIEEDVYESFQSYNEENILEPREINGKMYYVDDSNYIFDYENKEEILGKYSDSDPSKIIWLNP